jgi:hypothetical protein
VREFGERHPEAIVGGDLVLAAAQVVDEGVTGRDRAQRSDRFQGSLI